MATKWLSTVLLMLTIFIMRNDYNVKAVIFLTLLSFTFLHMDGLVAFYLQCKSQKKIVWNKENILTIVLLMLEYAFVIYIHIH